MAENRFIGVTAQPPQMSRVLIVDDNDRYAKVISDEVQSRGATVERAYTALQALEMMKDDVHRFDGIITDISMENQISGLRVIRRAKRLGFKGVVTVATTGLDTPVGFLVNRFLLGTVLRCGYLIPKRPIKNQNRVIWIKV